MEIAWKIDLLRDGGERSERFVYCVTEQLSDPTTRYQMELLSHLGFQRNLKLKQFRQYFSEIEPEKPRSSIFTCLFLEDYWENELGQEVPRAKALQALFGIPEGSLRLVSTEPHYISLQIGLANGESAFGEQLPQLSAEDQFVLRHFTCDVIELHQSEFISHPFSFSGEAGGPQQLRTIGREAVGHFISVFRRLYANGEPANFGHLCDAVRLAFPNTLVSSFLSADRKVLRQYLSHKVQSNLAGNREMSFKRDQLINNFMYGHFLHQPDLEKESIRAVWSIEIGGALLLEAVFYETVFHVALVFINWGHWTFQLCNAASVDLTVDSTGASITSPHPAKWRPELRLSADQRVHFDNYAAELAAALRDNDFPPNRTTASAYFDRAKELLRAVL